MACCTRWGCAFNQSNAQIIKLSVLNGLIACSAKSSQRSSSNNEKCKLKRRSISTSHWCCKVSGTIINTRCTFSAKSWFCKIIPASMVLPNPTSSAKSTRGLIRFPTSCAIWSWWGIKPARLPRKPRKGDWNWACWCWRVWYRNAKCSLRSICAEKRRSFAWLKEIIGESSFSLTIMSSPCAFLTK